MNRSLSLAVLIFSASAYGQAEFPIRLFGDQVGNGGKSVVCRNESSQIVQSQLLDFYEADVLYGLRPAFTGGTFLEKARDAFNRLAVHDRERQQRYQQLLDQFLSNTKFIPSPLIETPDSDHIVTPPSGCEIEQLAVQMQPTFPNDRLFTINREIWDSLNEDNKAGLVLHEIIYFEAIARGHKNSIAVRYLNANIASNSVSHMPTKSYLAMLKSAKLGTYHWRDRESGRRWTFLDSVEANWSRAKDACSKILGATLPTSLQLLENADALTHSPILDLVSGTELPESWSSTRRIDDGYIAVGIWSSAEIEIFYRHHSSDFANVVCINN